MKLDYEYYKTLEEVRKHIQECEGKHSQQVAYSTFHDALTQICYGCKKVRSSYCSSFDKQKLKEIEAREAKEANMKPKKWEEDFDDMFYFDVDDKEWTTSYYKDGMGSFIDEVKSFISKELDQARKEEREKLKPKE